MVNIVLYQPAAILCYDQVKFRENDGLSFDPETRGHPD